MSNPRVEELSEAEEVRALERVSDVLGRERMASDFVDDVKSTILFKPGFNWSTLLGSAPMSISLLGSLFMASTIPDATRIMVAPPDGGFKYLRNWGTEASLNACLIQCSDQGAKAFQNASMNFDAISLKSSAVRSTVNNIMGLLQDPRSARKMLKPTVKTLFKLAKDCEKSAREVDSSFGFWLEMVSELHGCVVQTSTDAAKKKLANDMQLHAAQQLLADTESIRDKAKETMDTFEANLKTSAELYKKAAKEFPTGWELVAQQFVSDLGSSLTTAINLAVPALIESYTMSNTVQGGVNIFKGGHGGVKGPGAGPQPDHSQVPASTSVPPVIPSTVTPYSKDPAFGTVALVRGYIGSIRSLLVGGPKGGINWDALINNDPQGKNNLKFWAALLSLWRQNFKPSMDPPSQTILRVCGQVEKIIDEVESAVNQHKAINGKPLPAEGSDQVKAWQQSIEAVFDEVLQLDFTAQSLTTAMSVPNLKDPSGSPADKPSGGTGRQIVDAATTKLSITASVLQTNTTALSESSKKYLEVLEQVRDIRAQIAALDLSNIDLEKVKDILQKCMEILVELKTHISNLVAFFAAVSTVIEQTVSNQVDIFVQYLEASTDETQGSNLDFSFGDYQMQLLVSFALSVQAWFSIFKDISGMYIDVHVQYIRPGLELVNQMQVQYSQGRDENERKAILQERQKLLDRYTAESIDGVNELVTRKQQGLGDGLDNRFYNAANDLAALEVRPSATASRAIMASSAAVLDTASRGIARSNRLLVRPLGDTSPLST